MVLLYSVMLLKILGYSASMDHGTNTASWNRTHCEVQLVCLWDSETWVDICVIVAGSDSVLGLGLIILTFLAGIYCDLIWNYQPYLPMATLLYMKHEQLMNLHTWQACSLHSSCAWVICPFWCGVRVMCRWGGAVLVSTASSGDQFWQRQGCEREERGTAKEKVHREGGLDCTLGRWAVRICQLYCTECLDQVNRACRYCRCTFSLCCSHWLKWRVQTVRSRKWAFQMVNKMTEALRGRVESLLATKKTWLKEVI